MKLDLEFMLQVIMKRQHKNVKRTLEYKTPNMALEKLLDSLELILPST